MGTPASRSLTRLLSTLGKESVFEMIQQMGILLRLPQVVLASAQVMFHRFYAKRSLYKFDARVRGPLA